MPPKPDRHLGLEQLADALTDLVEPLDASALAMRASVPNTLMANGIDEPLTFSNSSAGPLVPYDSVDDLGDLEVRVDLRLDPLEVAVLLERAQEVAKIVIGHAMIIRQGTERPPGASKRHEGTSVRRLSSPPWPSLAAAAGPRPAGRHRVRLRQGLRQPPAAAPTTQAAPTTAAPLADCGAAPVTGGPSKGLIGATLSGPATAPAGSVLSLVVHLRSLDGKSHKFDSGAAPVAILQAGRIVGEYQGAFAAYGTEQVVKPTQDSTSDVSVLLSGCPKLPLVDSAPDLTRKPLPAGDYQLVVDLPDVSGKPFGDLVSAPMDLHVTDYPSTLPTCGDVPASTGPSSEKLGGLLTAPAAAAAGSTVPVQVQLRSFRGKAEPLESGLPIEVLIVKDGLVVGRPDGPIAGVGIRVTVPPSGTTPLIPSDATSNKLFNSAVTLSGCPETKDTKLAVTITAQALATGRPISWSLTSRTALASWSPSRRPSRSRLADSATRVEGEEVERGPIW